MNETSIRFYPELFTQAITMGHLVVETGVRLGGSKEEQAADQDRALSSLIGSNDITSMDQLSVLKTGLLVGMAEEQEGVIRLELAA